jgi:transcription initiation factor TFIID TATA-box-binding protein
VGVALCALQGCGGRPERAASEIRRVASISATAEQGGGEFVGETPPSPAPATPVLNSRRVGQGGGELKYPFKYYISRPMRVRIENVVASTSLGGQLDLPRIAVALDGAEYEPTRFPGLIYRMVQPKTAILLFQSGKVVCTGGKSRKQVEDSIRIVSDLIRKGGQKVIARPKIEVQNIVATSDLGAEINLDAIAITLGLDRVEYEPEQFPGLVCRLEEPRAVILLFGSGKLVCTGARRPIEVQQAVQKITLELRGAGLLPAERRASSPSPVDTPSAPRPSTPPRNRPADSPARPPGVLARPTGTVG